MLLEKGFGRPLIPIYRLIIMKLRPNYVKKQLSLRKGKCKICDACCSVGNFRCRFLNEDGSCSVYDERLKKCPHIKFLAGVRIIKGNRVDDLFPIDRTEQILANVQDRCSFSWR